MANCFCSLTPFDFNEFQGSYFPLNDFEIEEAIFKANQDQYLLELEVPQHQQPKSNDLTLDEFDFNTIFPPTQPIQESTGLPDIPTKGSEIPEHTKQISRSYSLASLELLRNHGSGFKKLRGEKLNNISTDETKVGTHKLSTEEIMRVAGARYVQFSTQNQ